MSSESVTRENLELSDPDDLDDEFEEPEDFDDPDEPDEAGYDQLTLDDEADNPDDPDDPDELAALASGDSEPVLLVWPRDEYEEVDQRWPEVLEPIGADSWEDYRRHYQTVIGRWTRRGLPPLLQVTGSADGFEEWLAEQGADPLSVDLVAMADRYGHYLAEQSDAVELPPGPADPCWCGSGDGYARCCRPFSPT